MLTLHFYSAQLARSNFLFIVTLQKFSTNLSLEACDAFRYVLKKQKVWQVWGFHILSHL